MNMKYLSSMIFLSRNKTFRSFILLFMLIFIVMLLYNVRNSEYFKLVSRENNEIRISRNPALLHSNSQDYCLKKYLLDEQTLFSDPQRISELVTRNVSEAYVFTNFLKIVESLNVKICIIEPSILHCLLPNKYRELLIKRNFSLSNFTGSKYVITFGIFEEDATILQKEKNVRKFRSVGLQPYFVEVPLAPWMKEDDARFRNDEYTSHIFFMYYTWTFHIIVFYKRSNYLWHAALGEDNKDIIDNNLLFAQYDSAYENFTFQPVHNITRNFPSIYIPSSPHYFLFQMPSSRFLECNLSRAIYIETTTSSPNSKQFNQNTLIALLELKIFFQDVLMNFWLSSGTLLGWYRQCDVIPYTSDVDFAAWASEIDDLNYIIKYFRENKKLHIVERMGLLEEALEFHLQCNGLRVDVFFIYKIDNGTWASGHRPYKGYYFRYYYPFFTLCSAELLQEKVHVPCEAEDVILIEYGDQWMHPISNWHYETSIHNRGPNIYWDEKRRPKSFQRY